MKILIDMNLSPRWVQFLCAAGFEASHWSEIGLATAKDAVIMAHAAANNLVILTHDLDFSAILAVTHGKKPSVIQVRAEDLKPEVLGEPLVQALRQMEVELEAGALLSFDNKRVRLRFLPLFAEKD